MLTLIQEVDVAVLLWIQDSIRNPVMDAILVVYTTMGNAGILWIAVSGIMLCFPRWRRIGLLALISMLLCYCFNDVLIKNLVMRPRPLDTVEQLTVLVPPLSSSSFASGHTVSTFAAVNIYRRKTSKMVAAALFFLAILMGFSRVYVGMHYPSDVLVGMIIGLAGSQLVWYWSRRLLSRRDGKKPDPETL